jgi:hypothetical protein
VVRRHLGEGGLARVLRTPLAATGAKHAAKRT